MTETLGTIFERSPKEALEERFRREKVRLGRCYRGTIFCYQSMLGTDGVRYGSFKDVSEKDLATRQYEIEFLDYAIGIFWTDVLHDTKTYKTIPKELP